MPQPIAKLPSLGKYRLIEVVGRGGMGVVYKGQDPTLQRVVAIKVLHPQLGTDPGFVKRFLNDARQAARLNHRSIIDIYEVHQSAGYTFIVMSFVDGESLEKRIRRQGPMPVIQALAILGQIADALDFAHTHNTIHCDVKPANILIDAHDQVTLTDFGVARAAEGPQMTQAGMLIGTPAYMAPEQFTGEGVTFATDIYAFGLIAYELFSGHVPFMADTAHSVMYQHVHETPPALHHVNHRLPATMDAVIQKALSKNPGQRYKTAIAFVEALAIAAEGKRAPGTRWWERFSRQGQRVSGGRTRSAAVLPIVAALLALAVIALLALLINRGVTEPQRRLQEARFTATALAVEAGALVAATALSTAKAEGATTAVQSIDFPATLTAVAAERIAAVAKVNALETEVAQGTGSGRHLAADLPTTTPGARSQPSPHPTPPNRQGVIALGVPSRRADGMMTFVWNSPTQLAPGETFDVRVCHGDCQPRFGKTNTSASGWSWCPDEGEGAYRWRVVVISTATRDQTGAASPIGQFDWERGDCGVEETKAESQSTDDRCKDYPDLPGC